MRRRRWQVAGLLVAAYLAVAYLVVPTMWRRHYLRHPSLADTPRITRTGSDLPGDPLNVALVGSREQVEAAIRAAGWQPASALGVRSDVRIAESVLLDRPDPVAPVSTLFLFGRKEDLAFEREAGDSARQRHHVRLWQAPGSDEQGRPLWLGAATFDARVGFSHETGQITHHIGPDIDAERDLLMNALAHGGWVGERWRIDGIGPTQDGRNGGGDRYFTDGMIDGAVLRAP
jgi:LssY C-terminus